MSDVRKHASMKKWVYLSVAFFILYPLLLNSVGLSNIELGGKAMVDGAISNTLVRTLICVLMISLVFVGPFTVFIRPLFLDRTEVERVLASVFFLGLPLASYVYYEGSIKSAMDYHEWALLVLPAIILSSVLYERTEKLWVFLLALNIGYLFPLYFVNDLMAPVVTLLNTTAQSEWLYFWRTLGTTTFVGIVAACAPERAQIDQRREYRATVILLAATWLFLEFLLPSLMKSLVKDMPMPTMHQWEWALLIALTLSMFAKREIGTLASLALSATLLVASSYSIIDLMQSFERDFWKLTWAVFHLSVLITAAKTFVLMRANISELKPLLKFHRA